MLFNILHKERVKILSSDFLSSLSLYKLSESRENILLTPQLTRVKWINTEINQQQAA